MNALRTLAAPFVVALVGLAKRDARARLGLLVLGAFVVVAVVGPLFVGDPGALVGVPLQPPSWAHWLPCAVTATCNSSTTSCNWPSIRR